MSRIAYCPACAAHEHGVKTRIALEHTCGLERGEVKALDEPTAKAVCRGCGKTLNGKPYFMGGAAYDPKTNKRCKVNFYGGFVCSSLCDKEASLELERTMPGHTQSQSSLSSGSYNHWVNNWKQ